MSIPKIIHQTWKDNDVPGHFLIFSNTWKEYHRDWTFILWTDAMNRTFIQENYPAFLTIYDSYPENIQRVDAIRYFILLKHGGVYIDLDFECLENIEPLLEGKQCVLGEEPEEHCLIHNKKLIISNAFMASEANHLFFHSICDELERSSYDSHHPNNMVLESTGSFMITRVYNNYDYKNDVTLLKSNIISPLSSNEVQQILNNDVIPSEIQDKIDTAYAVHYYWGTWWKYKTFLRQRQSAFSKL